MRLGFAVHAGNRGRSHISGDSIRLYRPIWRDLHLAKARRKLILANTGAKRMCMHDMDVNVGAWRAQQLDAARCALYNQM